MDEFVQLLTFVKKHFFMKYEIILLLMATTPMRPQSILGINLADFERKKDGSIDYSRLYWIESKTEKAHSHELILPSVAKRIELYCLLNSHNMPDGWLFPAYKVHRDGLPYMHSDILSIWFSKDVRKPLSHINRAFGDRYPMPDAPQKWQYRISIYSIRRLYETYFFIKNGKNDLAAKMLREVMYYSSSFDPTKHYIKVIEDSVMRERLIEETYSPLAAKLVENQTQIPTFC